MKEFQCQPVVLECPRYNYQLEARKLVMKFLCPDGGCGSCKICNSIMTGACVDLLERYPPYSVSLMRNIIKCAKRRPYQCVLQAIVLHGSDKLYSVHQEMLLKVLEESVTTLFILVTASRYLLKPTIISRSCIHRIAMKGLKVDVMVEPVFSKPFGDMINETRVWSQGKMFTDKLERLLETSVGMSDLERTDEFLSVLSSYKVGARSDLLCAGLWYNINKKR